jgi:glycerol-3-phosphate dehydrogenase (NAD(P)+)
MAESIVILGDGAMATVCANVVAKKSAASAQGEGREVRMWVRDPSHLAAMEQRRESPYLPGVPLAKNLRLLPTSAALFEGATLILCAVPTQYIRGALSQLKPFIPPGAPVVSVAKGIEISTLKRPSEIIIELLGGGGMRDVAALSGPSIAGELARGLPCTMVVACNSQDGAALAKDVQDLFTTPYLRVYRNEDLLGVELAGALKNVIAVAAGILDGMQAGNNAKAALLTRGLVEITRLGTALGASAETFAGLAGMGDLVTTCVSPEGRNRSFGERVGRGEFVADALAHSAGVVEGVPTCEAVVRIARARGIEMPIAEGLHAVLFEGRNAKEQLAELMGRAPKHEGE